MRQSRFLHKVIWSSLRLTLNYSVFNIFKAVFKFSILLRLYFYAHNRATDRTMPVQAKKYPNPYQGFCAHGLVEVNRRSGR